MSELRKRMEALVVGPRTREEAAEEGAEDAITTATLKPLIQQLVLAMQATGMDSSDDDEVEEFLKMVKAVATTKKSLFKTALKQWSGSRATRAVKTAKASL